MSLKSFTNGYIKAALWSSTDDNGDPLDESPELELSDEAREIMEADARAFYSAYSDKWDDDEQAGHDFWLTRNGHGAGFWDGDYPEPKATELTDAAQAYGEVDLYVGDDGKIYHYPNTPAKVKNPPTGNNTADSWNAGLAAAKAYKRMYGVGPINLGGGPHGSKVRGDAETEAWESFRPTLERRGLNERDMASARQNFMHAYYQEMNKGTYQERNPESDDSEPSADEIMAELKWGGKYSSFVVEKVLQAARELKVPGNKLPSNFRSMLTFSVPGAPDNSIIVRRIGRSKFYVGETQSKKTALADGLDLLANELEYAYRTGHVAQTKKELYSSLRAAGVLPPAKKFEYFEYPTAENPSTSDMEDLAFEAGKEWGQTGSWSSGVSNANVRRYGFVKWWNNTLTPATERRVRKSAVERAFYEGYKIGREKANQGFRERAKGRRNPGGGRFGNDESDLTGSVIEFVDPMTGDGRIMHSTVVHHGPSTVRTRSGETIRLRDIGRVWDKAAYVRIFGKVPEGPIAGRQSNPTSSAEAQRMAQDILARVKRAGGVHSSVLKNIGGGYDLFVYKLNSLHRDWKTHQFGVDLTASGQKIESRVYRDAAELLQGLTHAIMTKKLSGVDHLGRESNPDSESFWDESVYDRAIGWEHIGYGMARLYSMRDYEVLANIKPGPNAYPGFQVNILGTFEERLTPSASEAVEWAERKVFGRMLPQLAESRKQVENKLAAYHKGTHPHSRSNPEPAAAGLKYHHGGHYLAHASLGSKRNPGYDWPGADSVYRKIQGFLSWYALQQNYGNRYGAKGRQIGPGYSITQDHQEMVEELNRGNEEELKRRLQWIRTFYPNYPLDSKRNPEPAAADLYESFHGKPSEEILEIGEEVHYHENLAGLGTLTEIKLDCFSGYSTELKFDRDTQLCSNEEGTQLYIVGGDQSLDLKALKFKDDEIDKDQVAIGVITEITYNTEKGFHNFKPTDYYHELGEESGYQPILTYDARSQLLTVAGGAYKIKPEGIVN